MIDLDELERLCREATRGPWESLRTCVYFAHGIGGFDIANCPKPETNAELIAALRNAAPKLIAMARLGKIAIRYIDRANDVADCDPADRILSEWAAEVNAVLAAMQEQEQSDLELARMQAVLETLQGLMPPEPKREALL